VWDSDRYIVWEGEINGKWKSGEIQRQYTLANQIAEFEHYWRNQEIPTEVQFSCARVRNGHAYANCRYFGVCWPELPRRGPFDSEAM
jgi:hypothetical protein